MAAVSVRIGEPGADKQVAQQRDQAIGMQWLGANVTPPIHPAEHRARPKIGRFQPVLSGLDRTQARERGHLVGSAGRLPVALAARQETGHSFAGDCFQMRHFKAQQLVAPEAPPEPQQHQGTVATMPQPRWSIAA